MPRLIEFMKVRCSAEVPEKILHVAEVNLLDGLSFMKSFNDHFETFATLIDDLSFTSINELSERRND